MDIFMRIALEEAEYGMSINAGGPFGAAIAKEGELLARAHNEVVKSSDPTAHAEILAIRRAAAALKHYELSGCELFSSCEPCPMCLSAIYWARIERVYFALTRQDAAVLGFDDKHIYDVIKGESGGNVEMVQLEREKFFPLMRRWEEKKDKIIY